MEELPLIAVVGPTAVGKTAIGIELAKRLNGEIISADAVAVYKGLDIGSAKPTEKERQNIPFHLIDVVHPDEEFTVTEFSRLTEETIQSIRGRHHIPIIVGGTGLYVRSVTVTLTVPNVPPQPEIRAQLAAEAEQQGAAALHERLQQIDPQAAGKIHPGDVRRIIRALEVYQVTGSPLSAFHTPEGIHGIPHPNTFLFGLRMERERLYERIDARVDAMMQDGLVAEVRELRGAGYGAELKSMQSLGYRHIAQYLGGEKDLETVVAELKRDTRRYAKRQMIWFNADPNIIWYDVDKIVPSLNAEGIKTLAEEIGDALLKRVSQN